MKGYAGKILYVDLTTGQSRVEKLGDELIRKFMGGRGLATKLFFDAQRKGIDPLSGENNIVVATGPFTGTLVPTGSKYIVVTKSPATGTYLEAYSSGVIATALKCAGYDALVVTGKRDNPSMLVINNDSVEIRDAGHLWGKDNFETERSIIQELGSDFGVMSIGQAGENLCPMAGINSDFYRQAARGGGGAVFGSKNLKAIAVRGTKYGVSCHDPEAMMEFQRKHKKQLEESFIGKIRKKHGTTYSVNFTNASGMLPTRNFQTGVCKEAEGAIDAFGVEKLTVKSKSCFGCVESCSKVNQVKDGPFKGLILEGPEYETLALMGSNLGITYLPAIIKSNELCDKYGLDTISVGNVIGFVMECYEKGLISKEDTDGKEIAFGNYEVVHELIEDIAFRRGFGKLLSMGVKHVAEHIGQDSYKFAMHVKGLEFPAYDPRASFGAGLAYAVTPRGACHRRCWPHSKEIIGNSAFTAEGKAVLVKEVWDSNSMYHSLLICDFPPKHIKITTEDYCNYFNVLTGECITPQDIQDMAERTETLIRLYNCNEGFTRKDDSLPDRMLYEPMPEGPAKGQCIGRENLDLMLDDYYTLRGWDLNGVPKEETLKALGL